MNDFAEIERDIEQIKSKCENTANPDEYLLNLGEKILENWLVAHDITPTNDKREGFRLLAPSPARSTA